MTSWQIRNGEKKVHVAAIWTSTHTQTGTTRSCHSTVISIGQGPTSGESNA